MPADPTERALRLLSLLQARRHRTGAELTSALGISERTLRRDVDRLRGLGYPVVSTTGAAGGYRLAAGSSLPPLLLDDDEVVAVVVAVRLSAQTAVAGIEDIAPAALIKLEQLLPARLRRRVDALGAVTAGPLWHDPSAVPVDVDLLSVLALASRDAERVRFRYRRADGAIARRDVEPHGLAAIDRRWYLAAWDLGRSAWRTFRLDRIDQVQPQGQRFVRRQMPGGDAAALVERSIARMPTPHDIVVEVDASRAAIQQVVSWAEIDVVQEDPGGTWTRVRLREGSGDWLALQLAVLATVGEVRLQATASQSSIDAIRRLSTRLAASVGALG
ncbi:helix-turn-helix transcriptional regulator [Euzebya tangerina]|uniref:helix-turn-helix transcriptional regulator n=1 Tax=Euzebya tangerina TaxID=591198 RepID=UPI000E31EE38|nr:YafY family protein [Euzebya tangerina]